MSSSGPRILFVARELTPTPRDGGGLRRRHLLDALRAVGPTAAFAFVAAPAPCEGLEAWVTATDPDAGRSLQGAAAAAAARAGRFPLGVVDSPATEAELRGLAADFAPDVVVVSSVELLHHLEVLRPHAPRLVLDLDYAQTTALAEMADADPHRARSLLWRHLLSGAADVERAVLAQVDQVWVSNDAERPRVQAAAGTDAIDIATVPNVVDVASYPVAARDDRHALVFPARFDYWPNEEAARLLVDAVLPALPHATLTLVGSSPPGWMSELEHPRVHVTGPVPDVRPYLAAAAVMPVPVRAGAGTRLKVLESFAAGLPLVSTATGVGGLDLVDGEHYLRAESADELVAAISRLQDDALAARLGANARAWVERHGSLPALHDAVRRALAVTTV